MYYEEKMIGGRLVYRTTPDGKWEVCAIEKTWDKITELQDKVNELNCCMRTISKMADDHT